MLPEILDSIEDVIDTLVPLLAFMVLMTGIYYTAKVWRGRGASQEALEAINEKLTTLLEQSDAVRGELGDIQDRVEFTERLLAGSSKVDSEHTDA